MSDTVTASFYFDFADVRSYLALAQLPHVFRDLPVHLDLVPVNANALAAFVGLPSRSREPAVRRYLQRDAERWARRRGIPLAWPSSTLTSGPALRVAMWLVQHAPDEAFEAVQGIFERVWRDGEPLTEATVREALLTHDVDADAALQAAARTEAFPAFEAAVEIAVSDGIFEVPTLRVAPSEDFVGFDRVAMSRHAVFKNLLRRAPGEQLVTLAADALVQLPATEQLRLLDSLDRTATPPLLDHDEPRNPRFDAIAPAIRVLPTIDATSHLPVAPPAGPLTIAIHPPPRLQSPVTSATDLRALVAEAPDAGVVSGPAPRVLTSLVELADELERGGVGTKSGGLLMPVVAEGRARLLHLPPVRDPDGAAHLHAAPRDLSEEGELTAHVLSTGRLAMLDGVLARDPAAHRKAARAGAHVIVLCGVAPGDTTATASAVRCGRWVITLGERIGVHDARGRCRAWDHPLSDSAIQLALPWPPHFPDDEGEPWAAEAPRTILVNERPLLLGPPDSAGDLGFAVAGNGLTVSGAGVTSTLSPTQPFSAIRHGFATVHVVPVLGEQLLAAERITAKLLDALSRRRHNAHVLIVNYWPELSYERLAELRPVLAATAREHVAPVLVVIGSRPVELWQVDARVNAFRVEAEGEVFALDLAQQPSLQQRRDVFVERHDDPEAYLAMLRTMRS